MKNKKRKLIYILSPSYSGSTLLTFLLSSHKDIATVGELKATSRGDLTKYSCSCGENILKCDFWAELKKNADREAIPFTLYEFGTHFRDENYICDRLLHMGVRSIAVEALRDIAVNIFPYCKKRKNDILLQNQKLIEIICKMQGKEVFLDGSKDSTRLKYFIKSNLWDIKVISLVRDGRATTASFMKNENKCIRDATNEWVSAIKEAENIKSLMNPTDYIETSYEELCDHTNKVLKRVYEFIGVEEGIANLSFGASMSHILGNSMRLGNLDEIKKDEKWKERLNSKDIDIFNSIGGMYNGKLGYN